MQLRDRVWHIRPVVPTASMADIAFLLIIFFMLTTSFSPDRRSIQLPDSVVREDVTEGAAIISVTEDNALFFTAGEAESEEVAGFAELAALIEGVTTLVPAKEFMIKADRNVPYETIDGVLEALRSNGARRVALLTRAQAITRENVGETQETAP